MILEEMKKTEALQPFMKKCKCGHTLTITNRYKRKICKWCGSMVYLNDNEQKKHDILNEVRRRLNENN